MIELLDNQNIEIARQMKKVFYASYSIEAKILKADNFPPLKRMINQYTQTNTKFYGMSIDKALAGIVEIRNDKESTHIQSLVVDPKYFKQGIASKLMTFVIEKYHSVLIFVETGVDNLPAIKLYEKFGFIQVKQWDTKVGIRKVRLEKYSLLLV